MQGAPITHAQVAPSLASSPHIPPLDLCLGFSRSELAPFFCMPALTSSQFTALHSVIHTEELDPALQRAGRLPGRPAPPRDLSSTRGGTLKGVTLERDSTVGLSERAPDPPVNPSCFMEQAGGLGLPGGSGSGDCRPGAQSREMASNRCTGP